MESKYIRGNIKYTPETLPKFIPCYPEVDDMKVFLPSPSDGTELVIKDCSLPNKGHSRFNIIIIHEKIESYVIPIIKRHLNVYEDRNLVLNTSGACVSLIFYNGCWHITSYLKGNKKF